MADAGANQIHSIDLEGKSSVYVADSGKANGLAVGADGLLYSVSNQSGKIMSNDVASKASVVLEGLRGHSSLALPTGGSYVTSNEGGIGSVWFVKDGQKTQVDTGLKHATGLAYRPDQWLLSVAGGHPKWVYRSQMNSDGSLTNKERFFWLHVADWDDDAGAESICYAHEGQMLVATRSGIQISADDGPTQVIIPLPDRSRVHGVCLGGKDMDTLFAFSGGKAWTRKVKVHATCAFSPWVKVNGTRL